MFKKQIPNSITALNLLSGIFAIIATFENALLLAGFFIALGAFFDFFDGMAARLLNVKSDMGKEMDISYFSFLAKSSFNSIKKIKNLWRQNQF